MKTSNLLETVRIVLMNDNIEKEDIAPDFTLLDQYGKSVNLSDQLIDKKVVLFFYPKASSPVCTKQACHFRSLNDEFASYNTKIYGISCDSPAKNKIFAEKNRLSFPLLSDPDKKVAREFSVSRRGLLGALLPVKRVTFIIGPGRKILARIGGEFNWKHHADAALEFLRNEKATEK